MSKQHDYYGNNPPPYPNSNQMPPYPQMPGGMPMPPPGNYNYQGPYQGQGPDIGFVNPIQPHGAGFQMPGQHQNTGGPDNKPLNPPYMDSADPDYVAGFGFDDKSIRRGFIRKVYSILTVQLLVTLGFIALFTLHEPTKQWSKQNPGVMMGACIGSIILVLAITCCESVRRKAPTNYIFLGLFTLCEGILLGFITSTYNVNEVLLAVGLTAVIVFSLTLFAFQTKYDFTVMGGVMCVGLVVLMGLSIVGIFYRNNFFHFMLACVGALIFSVYIIYDTQLMMGGSHKYSISPEEYVFAALNLYMDIIQLFIYLLRIMRYLNSD